MIRISLNRFGGQAPRISNRLLPEHMAVKAVNCKLASGGLQPFSGMSEVALPGGDAPVQSMFLYNNRHWLAFAADVDLVRCPLPGDPYGRIYCTGLGQPLVSDAGRLQQGQKEFGSLDGLFLGTPAPVHAPAPMVEGDPGGNVVSAAYVCTLVNEYGEEGPPSPASETIDRADGVAVTVANLRWPPADGAAVHGVKRRRLYRTATPASGSAVWRFALEGSAQHPSMADNVSDLDLAESLSSTSYAPPPPDMAGAVALPGGVLAGFTGNQVCFSEPYMPHAWPVQYRLATDYPVQALGVYGSTLVVATTAYPYLVTGVDPASMSMARLQDSQPCVSKRGVAASELGVLIPTDAGLYLVGPAGASRVTKGLFTRQEWRALNPASMHAVMHDGLYVAFFQPQKNAGVYGMLLDPLDPAAGVVFLDFYADAVYSDPETGILYLAMQSNGANRIMRWEGDPETTLSYTWRSRPLAVAGPVNMGALRAQADYPEYASQDEMNVLAAQRQAVLDANAARLADPAPLGGALNGAAVHVRDVNGADLETVPTEFVQPAPLRVDVEADGAPAASLQLQSSSPARLPAGFTAREWTLTVIGNLPTHRLDIAGAIRDLTE